MDLIEKAKDLFAEKVANMPMPEASVADVDIKGITLECVTYQAAVAVKSPYCMSIPICEISYVLKSAGRVGDCFGNNTGSGGLKANETPNLEFPVKAP